MLGLLHPELVCLVAAKLMGLGAGEGIEEEHSRLVHLLLLFSLASYPTEGISLRKIWLEPSMAAVQHCCSARKGRKRGG